ncbi:TIGR00730 family Rossman fold protein [Candidatus Uhrbacteria bacterium]|nr:TIGR00730 family Rossman fold protein [Candidatus Uhrbacteria bacterium]
MLSKKISQKKKKGGLAEDRLICRLPRAVGEPQDQQTQLYEISWRIFRIMSEFVSGFQFLSTSSQEVTFWGSARLKPESPWYQEAVKLGAMLSKKGFTIITGGGGGIMEAGNKGAYEAGGESIGLNIELPFEQSVNQYVTKTQTFHYFFTRKVMMAASAQAYVFFPGGFGTLDEFFEIITLIQTKKMQCTPVVCVGHAFWDGLFEWSAKVQRDDFQTIGPKDLELIQIVDTAEEAYKIVARSKERSFF